MDLLLNESFGQVGTGSTPNSRLKSVEDEIDDMDEILDEFNQFNPLAKVVIHIGG